MSTAIGRWIRGVAGLAVLMLAVTAISAQAESVGTKITIDSLPYFSGKVKSDRHACRAKRKVRLFERTGPDTVRYLGKDTANRRGRFTVPIDISSQEVWVVFAKARRKVVRDDLTCRRAISKNFTLD